MLRTNLSRMEIQPPLAPIKTQQDALNYLQTVSNQSVQPPYDSKHTTSVSLQGIGKASRASLFAAGSAQKHTGVPLKALNHIPADIRNNTEFQGAVLQQVYLAPDARTEVLGKYLKQPAGRLSDTVLQDTLSELRNMRTAPINQQDRARRQGLIRDVVIIDALNRIEDSLQANKNEQKNNENFKRNIQGFEQAISTLHHLGVAFKSPQLQKISELLGHGLNLTVAVMQITGSTPAFLSSGLGLGASLGPPAMAICAALAIFSLLGKKKRNEDNLPQIIISYLQYMSKQFYDLQNLTIAGFRTVIENQEKQNEFFRYIFEHVDKLLRMESQETRISIQAVKDRLIREVDTLSKELTAVGHILHKENFDEVIRDANACIKRKESNGEKVADVARRLVDWVKPDITTSANPLHNGLIRDSKDNEDLQESVTSILKTVETNPKTAYQAMGLLASIMVNELGIPLQMEEVKEGKENKTEQLESEIEVKNLPREEKNEREGKEEKHSRNNRLKHSVLENPEDFEEEDEEDELEEEVPAYYLPNVHIVQTGINKYIELRRAFPDIVTSQDELFEMNESLIKISSFINHLQTKPDIFAKLLARIQSGYNDIEKIIQSAIKEKNKEINRKLLNKSEEKELKEEEMIFDITKPHEQSLLQIDNNLFSTIIPQGSFSVGFLFNCFDQYSTLANKSWSFSTAPKITFGHFKNDMQNQTYLVRNLIFLQNVGSLENKSKYTMRITARGNDMGDINLDISVTKKPESKTENDSKPISLFTLKYNLVGNAAKSINVRFLDPYCPNERVAHVYAKDGFDSDLAAYTHWIDYIGKKDNRINISAPENMALTFLGKKRLDGLVVATNFEESKQLIQKLFNDYFIKHRKEIIALILGNGYHPSREGYQRVLEEVYKKLDYDLALLKAYAILAGLTSTTEVSEDNCLLPSVIKQLPNSSYFKKIFENYLGDSTTITTPWPGDNLIPNLRVARDTIAAALRLNMDPLSRAEAISTSSSSSSISSSMAEPSPVEEKSELAAMPVTIFSSPLQKQMGIIFRKLLIFRTANERVVTILSEKELQNLESKIMEYGKKARLMNGWINKFNKQKDTDIPKEELTDLLATAVSLNKNIDNIIKLSKEQGGIPKICSLMRSVRDNIIEIYDNLSLYCDNFRMVIDAIVKDQDFLDAINAKCEKFKSQHPHAFTDIPIADIDEDDNLEVAPPEEKMSSSQVISSSISIPIIDPTQSSSSSMGPQVAQPMLGESQHFFAQKGKNKASLSTSTKTKKRAISSSKHNFIHEV